MAMIIGGAATIVAIVAGIMAQIDSITIMERAGIAFVIGWVLGLIWQMLSTIGGNVEFIHEDANAKHTDSHVHSQH